jgi:hypothetical protein
VRKDPDLDAETVDGDASEEDEDSVESMLSDIKSHRGNASLNSLMEELGAGPRPPGNAARRWLPSSDPSC